jgi:hypothetical protein
MNDHQDFYRELIPAKLPKRARGTIWRPDSPLKDRFLQASTLQQRQRGVLRSSAAMMAKRFARRMYDQA